MQHDPTAVIPLMEIHLPLPRSDPERLLWGFGRYTEIGSCEFLQDGESRQYVKLIPHRVSDGEDK
jgi:hypothetical protein